MWNAFVGSSTKKDSKKPLKSTLTGPVPQVVPNNTVVKTKSLKDDLLGVIYPSAQHSMPETSLENALSNIEPASLLSLNYVSPRELEDISSSIDHYYYRKSYESVKDNDLEKAYKKSRTYEVLESHLRPLEDGNFRLELRDDKLIGFRTVKETHVNKDEPHPALMHLSDLGYFKRKLEELKQGALDEKAHKPAQNSNWPKEIEYEDPEEFFSKNYGRKLGYFKVKEYTIYELNPFPENEPTTTTKLDFEPVLDNIGLLLNSEMAMEEPHPAVKPSQKLSCEINLPASDLKGGDLIRINIASNLPVFEIVVKEDVIAKVPLHIHLSDLRLEPEKKFICGADCGSCSKSIVGDEIDNKGLRTSQERRLKLSKTEHENLLDVQKFTRGRLSMSKFVPLAFFKCPLQGKCKEVEMSDHKTLFEFCNCKKTLQPCKKKKQTQKSNNKLSITEFFKLY